MVAAVDPDVATRPEFSNILGAVDDSHLICLTLELVVDDGSLCCWACCISCILMCLRNDEG